MAKLSHIALLLASAAWLGAGAPAAAQQANDSLFSFLRNLTSGSAPEPAAPAQPTEGGTHPLMTPAAIAEATADFGVCLERLWPQAAKRGISRATYESSALTLTPDLKIMEFLDTQPEFTRALWDYLDFLVTDARIARGREILAQYASVFDAVEKTYGVDRTIITAIWGIESNFSTAGGERPVVRSTATLACIGRRQAYFRDEFLSALEILQRGDLRPEQLKGSWAGAFGPTQFMPTSFKRFAVDFDGDGRRDVVDSVPDLIASTANNLKKDGWVTGQTWGYEVALPPGFNYLLADQSRRMSLREWEQQGVRRIGGKPFPRPDDSAYLLVPAGARGPAFVMLNNFRSIMKYNPSEAYALAIGHLADRMRGGGAFLQPWPRDERVLSRAERYEMQQLLAARGFDIGQPDGKLGGKTRVAIRQFQASVGEPPDGFASNAVLGRLRAR
jgi:membrane-bound lytic murein transglycosylase B